MEDVYVGVDFAITSKRKRWCRMVDDGNSYLGHFMIWNNWNKKIISFVRWTVPSVYPDHFLICFRWKCRAKIVPLVRLWPEGRRTGFATGSTITWAAKTCR